MAVHDRTRHSDAAAATTRKILTARDSFSDDAPMIHAAPDVPRWKIRSVPATLRIWRGSPLANCSRKSARAWRCAGSRACAAKSRAIVPGGKAVAPAVAGRLSQHHLSEQDPDHRHRGAGLPRQPRFAPALGDDRERSIALQADRADRDQGPGRFRPTCARPPRNRGTPIWISAQRGHELLTYLQYHLARIARAAASRCTAC